MRAIDLLPKDDARRGRPQRPQWLVLVPVVLAVLLTAVMSAMFLSASGKAKDKQSQLSALQAELAAIPTPDAAKVKTQSALAADKQARVTALSAALARRVARSEERRVGTECRCRRRQRRVTARTGV